MPKRQGRYAGMLSTLLHQNRQGSPCAAPALRVRLNSLATQPNSAQNVLARSE